MFSRNVSGELARSSVDVRELTTLFSIKDPLRLGDSDGSIFQSYEGIEEMVRSYVHEHRSFGGLNGLVSGGPRAADIFETLVAKVISSQEHVDSELQRRIRTRAVMRLYVAIVRKGRKQENPEGGSASGIHSTTGQSSAKLSSELDTHDSAAAEISSPRSQVVFSAVAVSPQVSTAETILSDLLFASGLSVGIATLNSLQGTAFYERSLRSVFESLIGVFGATLRSVQ